MTILLITAAICLIGLTARSQTFSEWWHQKKTRLKYLREQVAALKSVEYVIRHGYNIQEGGLYDIRQINEEEWNLHDDFFDDLETVSLIVKDCPEVEEALDIKYATDVLIAESMTEFRKSPWLTPLELNETQRLFKKMNDELTSAGSSIARTIIDRNLKMTSGERLIEIRIILDQIKEKYGQIQFCVAFITGVITEREKECNDQNHIIHLN